MTAVEPSQVTASMTAVSSPVRCASTNACTRGSRRAASSCWTTSWVRAPKIHAPSPASTTENVSANPVGVPGSRRRRTQPTGPGNRRRIQASGGVAAKRSPSAWMRSERARSARTTLLRTRPTTITASRPKPIRPATRSTT